jgi:hypothetical protein
MVYKQIAKYLQLWIIHRKDGKKLLEIANKIGESINCLAFVTLLSESSQKYKRRVFYPLFYNTSTRMIADEKANVNLPSFIKDYKTPLHQYYQRCEFKVKNQEEIMKKIKKIEES